jgi:hypothetical protein
MLTTVVAATAKKKTAEREWHPWNERSSCSEIHG